MKLPVFKSVGEVFSGVTRHFFQLAFAAWPAVLCFIALDLAQDWTVKQFDPLTVAEGVSVTGDIDADQHDALPTGVWLSPLVVISTAYMLLNLLVGMIAAVRWHRFVLLGESGAAVRHVRHEDVAYIWTSFQLWIMTILAVCVLYALWLLTPDMLRVSVVVVCGIAALVVGTRLSLALPGAALGYGGGFTDVFRKSAGNSFRVLGLFLLISLLTIIPLVAIMIFIAPPNSPLESMLGATGSYLLSSVIRSLVSLYILMLNITVLSVAYREIVGLPGSSELQASPFNEPTVA